MAKDFLLDQVIEELIDPKVSLVGPLLKLQYFATLTKNAELLNFVKSELNGYNNGDLPEYRLTSSKIHVDLKIGPQVNRSHI